jgi:soluble lytic murein transglycosylase-like protein
MKILFILLILLIPAMSKEAIFTYHWQTPEITAIVEREAQKHNFNPRLVYNLIDAESSGRVNVKHPLIRIRVKGKLIKTRAIGLMGVIQEYHFKGTKAQLEQPANNISTGLKVLSNCVRLSKGDVIKGLMRYNGQVTNINMAYVNKILKGVKIDLTKYI